MRKSYYICGITITFLTGIVLLIIYKQSTNKHKPSTYKPPENKLSGYNYINYTRPIYTPTSLRSPFLSNCTAANCDQIAIIRQLASSGPRLYLHDFELNLLLFDAHKINSTKVWFKSTTPADLTNIDDVVFIIMSSSVTKSKAKNLVSSWLQMTKNFYFFTDQNDSTIPNFMTLPELFNLSTKSDAQHRQLRGMKWLRANKPEISSKNWFALVDDDTWLNIPALLHFLHSYSPDLPLNFGYVWDNMWEPGRVVQSGGSGMILSRNAFQQLADHLYTKTFDFQSLNDITIANGCKALGILIVHSDKFYWDKVATVGDRLYPPNYVAKISYHYATDPNFLLRMTCDSALFWNFPLPQNCNVTDRFTEYLKI